MGLTDNVSALREVVVGGVDALVAVARALLSGETPFNFAKKFNPVSLLNRDPSGCDFVFTRLLISVSVSSSDALSSAEPFGCLIKSSNFSLAIFLSIETCPAISGD